MTASLTETKLLMDDEDKKKLKEIDDKHDAETKEIIKRLQDRKYWAFHGSTLVGIFVGLLCGIGAQPTGDGYSLYLFAIFFVCGFFATRPKFTIESCGKKTSRVIQILLICFLLFAIFRLDEMFLKSGLF